jgi:hypothetical protein
VLAFFGFDPQTHHFTRQDQPLTTCPVCGEPARVGKVVRPLGLLSADARTLAGAAVGQHFILFTRDCPRHSTPLEVGPGRTLGELEAAWRAGLSEVGIPLAAVRAWGEGSLVVGFDAGSLVLEPALLKAALQAGERPATGRWFACAFGPDAVVVTPTQLTGKVLPPGAAGGRRRGAWPVSWPRLAPRCRPTGGSGRGAPGSGLLDPMTTLALLAALLAPPTLGDGLRAIGALNQVDHTLESAAAPTPDRGPGAAGPSRAPLCWRAWWGRWCREAAPPAMPSSAASTRSAVWTCFLP